MEPSISLSEKTLSLMGGDGPKTLTYTYDGDGTVTVSSSDPSVATASISGNSVTVRYVSAGSAVVTVSASKTAVYMGVAASCQITCTRSAGSIALSASSITLYGGSPSGSFAITSQSGDGAVTVSSSDSSVATATLDGATVNVAYSGPGTATITVAKAQTDEYTAASATVAVTCQKSASQIILTETDKTIDGATGAGTFGIITRSGDGALSVSSTNSAVATAYIDGTVGSGDDVQQVVHITYVGAGTADIIVTKAATAKYNAVSATCKLTCARTSVTTPSLASTSVAWSGSTVSVGVNNYDANLMTQSGTASANSVGTWTVTWTLKNTVKYCWSDGTSTAKSASWSTYSTTITIYLTGGSHGYGNNRTVTGTVASWDSFIGHTKDSKTSGSVYNKKFYVSGNTLGEDHYNWSYKWDIVTTGTAPVNGQTYQLTNQVYTRD